VQVVQLRYDFLRIEYNSHIVAGPWPEDVRQGWLVRFRAVGRRVWNKLVSRLLAPVDYPLELSSPAQLRREADASVEQEGPG
jgi:hypothetical protein